MLFKESIGCLKIWSCELRKYFPKYVRVLIDVVSFLSYKRNKKKFGDQTYFKLYVMYRSAGPVGRLMFEKVGEYEIHRISN